MSTEQPPDPPVMTLAEAIEHAEEQGVDLEGTACGVQHRQLADWLKELRDLRNAPTLNMMWAYGEVAKATALQDYPSAYESKIRAALAYAGDEVDHLRDDIIDLWHGGKIEGELHEALAMTQEEYAAWVEGR
jgi:hypothetical protein